MALGVSRGVRIGLAAILLAAAAALLATTVISPAEAHKKKFKAETWIVADKAADRAQGGIFNAKKKCANKRKGKLQARDVGASAAGPGRRWSELTNIRTNLFGNWEKGDLSAAIDAIFVFRAAGSEDVQLRTVWGKKRIGKKSKRHKHKCSKVRSSAVAFD